MSVNKVQLANGETIIDISDSTVKPETLAEGVTAHDASGQKITGKMVPGGGSKTVQTDWNQTDETAPDFLKNKPFGVELTEIMPETEVVAYTEEGLEGIYYSILDTPFSGDERTLLVTYDGIEYTCDAIGEMLGVLLFGNGNIIEEGVGGADEPFCIDPIGALLGVPALFVSDGEPHTIGIDAMSVEKLDAKYVSNFSEFYVSLEFESNKYLYTDVGLSNKATVRELTDAATSQLIRIGVSNGVGTLITVSPTVVSSVLGYVKFISWKYNDARVETAYTAEHDV